MTTTSLAAPERPGGPRDVDTNLDAKGTPPSEIPVRFRLIRGGYFSFLGTIVTVLGNFTVSVILARMLGSVELGVYTIYTILALVFVPLLSLSIPSAVTKFTSQFRESEKSRLFSILPTALAILTVAGVVGTLLMFWLLAPIASRVYDEPELLPMVRILGALVMANLLSLFSGAILQGLEEFQTSNLVGSVAVLANVPLLLWLVPGFGAVGAAAASALAALTNAIVTTYAASRALRKNSVHWRWSYSRTDFRTLLSFSGPLNLASLMARASVLVQNSLVAVYVGFHALGLLRVAGVFYSAILFLPRIMLAPMLPVLTSVTATRLPNRSRDILTRLVRLAVLVLVPLAGGLLVALPAAIELLYGSAFLPALPFAVVATLVAVFTFPNIILGEQYLLATGRTMRSLLVTSYSLAVGLSLTIALLPAIGAMALPLAGLISESTLFALLVAWTHRDGELALRSLVPTLAYAVMATASSVALSQFLPFWASLLVALPFAASLAAIGFFVLMDDGERDLIVSTLKGAAYTLKWRKT